MYDKSVERAFPGCLVFLLDQSYSMTDPFAGSARAKCEAVATAINRFLGEIITTCEKGEDKPRHYFDVAVIGYTTDKAGRPAIGSLLQGLLAGRDLVSVVELYDHPLDVETRLRKEDDGAGGLIDVPFQFPIWYRVPDANHMAGTPMCGALQRALEITRDWCVVHPYSFPPVVIHLTDGESGDGNPEPIAEELRSLSTADGNVLLFNCHLSSSQAEPVLFPTDEGQLHDEYGRMLFRMSSVLPPRLQQMADVKNLAAPPGARGMAFNADATRMLMLISVGTSIASAQNLR
jgi:hypothetical protein